jgi:ketosteroid isomerase-like protein
MKKKNGVNIMLFVLIIIFIFILSCVKNPKNPPAGILLLTDREFSEMSVREGMFKAFLSYIADDGVILRDNSYPSKGKENLKKHYEGRSDTSFVLSWEPLYEKISSGGDIGYTYGIHTNMEKGTGKITKGTYVTIWQKQSDGKWKFVLDTGTQGLPDDFLMPGQ